MFIQRNARGGRVAVGNISTFKTRASVKGNGRVIVKPNGLISSDNIVLVGSDNIKPEAL